MAYTCAAPTHLEGEGGPDKLTVHDGKWAYCSFNARADGHEWKPSQGPSLTMLKQMGAPSKIETQEAAGS